MGHPQHRARHPAAELHHRRGVPVDGHEPLGHPHLDLRHLPDVRTRDLRHAEALAHQPGDLRAAARTDRRLPHRLPRLVGQLAHHERRTHRTRPALLPTDAGAARDPRRAGAWRAGGATSLGAHRRACDRCGADWDRTAAEDQREAHRGGRVAPLLAAGDGRPAPAERRPCARHPGTAPVQLHHGAVPLPREPARPEGVHPLRARPRRAATSTCSIAIRNAAPTGSSARCAPAATSNRCPSS